MTHQHVLVSFTRIREAAEAHMDELDELGHGWAEELVTDVAVHRGHPHVKVVKFNRRQEAVVGGDYLWWWLDRSSILCFGMLVQAKRLTRSASSWKVDIYHNDGKQYSDLLRSSHQLQVPALYGIYTGGRVFRADLPCFHADKPDCLGCHRMAISMIIAYQLGGAWSRTSPRAPQRLCSAMRFRWRTWSTPTGLLDQCGTSTSPRSPKASCVSSC